jgi:O-antigen/teichoic acid export membrane protein
LNLALSLLLAPVFGALGVALATLISAVAVYYPGLVFLVRSELGPAASPRVTGAQWGGIVWPVALLIPALLQRTSLAVALQVVIAGSLLTVTLWFDRDRIRRGVEQLRAVSMA